MSTNLRAQAAEAARKWYDRNEDWQTRGGTDVDIEMYLLGHATGFSEGARAFAEWLAKNTPDTECSESAIWLEGHVNPEEGGSVSNAHRGYLIYLAQARKEPSK